MQQQRYGYKFLLLSSRLPKIKLWFVSTLQIIIQHTNLTLLREKILHTNIFILLSAIQNLPPNPVQRLCNTLKYSIIPSILLKRHQFWHYHLEATLGLGDTRPGIIFRYIHTYIHVKRLRPYLQQENVDKWQKITFVF